PSRETQELTSIHPDPFWMVSIATRRLTARACQLDASIGSRRSVPERLNPLVRALGVEKMRGVADVSA
ncbi:MAG: hypothetical protein ABSD31_19800, partial [Candidatus Binataceae bacterium]